eukprot:COSAG01_NODE_489_length_16370_cov_7.973818_9_plen_524_part_00
MVARCPILLLLLLLHVQLHHLVAKQEGVCEPSTPSPASFQRLIQDKSPTVGTTPTAAEKRWLAEEAAKRAPQYIALSENLAINGLRAREKARAQGREIDTFHIHHLAKQQVLGALDLSPTQSIQLDAAKMMLGLIDLDPKEGDNAVAGALEIAMSLAAAACRGKKRGRSKAQAKSRLQALLKWLDEPDSTLLTAGPAPREEIRKVFGQEVRGWLNRPNPPDLPFSYKYSNTSTNVTPVRPYGRVGSDAAMQTISESFKDQLLFPTHVITTNILAEVPAGFCERLSKLALRKYTDFVAAAPRDLDLTIAQLNNGFFMEQKKSLQQMQDPEARAWWPQMYEQSEDFKLLTRLMRTALNEFARRHDLLPPPAHSNDQHPDMYDLSMWAAVYPGDKGGARHGHHVHQGSLVSCVLYVQTLDSPLPIAFVDPRGGKPTDDFDSEISEFHPKKEREFAALGLPQHAPSCRPNDCLIVGNTTNLAKRGKCPSLFSNGTISSQEVLFPKERGPHMLPVLASTPSAKHTRRW